MPGSGASRTTLHGGGIGKAPTPDRMFQQSLAPVLSRKFFKDSRSPWGKCIPLSGGAGKPMGAKKKRTIGGYQ